MKKYSIKILIILALSLAIFSFFNMRFPEAELSGAATAVIVAVCAAAVEIVHWGMKRLQRLLRRSREPSPGPDRSS